jgi:hypothetical protein
MVLRVVLVVRPHIDAGLIEQALRVEPAERLSVDVVLLVTVGVELAVSTRPQGQRARHKHGRQDQRLTATRDHLRSGSAVAATRLHDQAMPVQSKAEHPCAGDSARAAHTPRVPAARLVERGLASLVQAKPTMEAMHSGDGRPHQKRKPRVGVQWHARANAARPQ